MPDKEPKSGGQVAPFAPGERGVFYRGGHISTAVRSLQSLRTFLADERAVEDRLRGITDPAERRRIRQEATPQGDPFALHDAAILYSALAVEGFLNVYGTARLGQVYFTAFIERLGTEQKLAVLLAIGTGQLVHGDAEIVRLLRSLFQRRGALVHPKARIPTDLAGITRAISQNLQREEDATAAVQEMREFFKLMSTFDPEVAGFLEEEVGDARQFLDGDDSLSRDDPAPGAGVDGESFSA